MKRLITVEEHFISAAMNEKIASIFRANGQEPKKQTLRQNIAEKVVSLGKDRIAYMDSVGVSAQLISYAGKFPGRMEPRYALPLCREVNHEMYEAAKLYPGRFYLLAHLPISSPKDASAELEYTVKNLGFKGAMISGVYAGHRLEEGLLPSNL